jgi:hypothetical protein
MLKQNDSTNISTVMSESNTQFENKDKNKNICIFLPVYILVKNLYVNM